GIPLFGRRDAETNARTLEPLVQLDGLLLTTRFRRPAGPLSRGAALEADTDAAALRRWPSERAALGRWRRRLLDHVETRGRRSQRLLAALPLRSPQGRSSAGQEPLGSQAGK